MPSSLPTMLRRRLGLEAGATRRECQAAFRQLAKEHHPDAGGDRERFEQVRQAWETLKELERW